MSTALPNATAAWAPGRWETTTPGAVPEGAPTVTAPTARPASDTFARARCSDSPRTSGTRARGVSGVAATTFTPFAGGWVGVAASAVITGAATGATGSLAGVCSA